MRPDVKTSLFIIACLVLGSVLFLDWQKNNQTVKKYLNLGISHMQLMSPAFGNNHSLPATYTCDGLGINPPLSIANVPADTKSLAIVVEDPDAPSGMFIHWTIWNISPKTININENSVPVGAAQGLNGAGKAGFIGACPPSGTHHYHFKLYALKTTLDLPATTTATELQTAIKDITLEQAELVATYHRPGKPE